MKRIFLIVLDSFGIGEMPDAANYGDEAAIPWNRGKKPGVFHAEYGKAWII